MNNLLYIATGVIIILFIVLMVLLQTIKILTGLIYKTAGPMAPEIKTELDRNTTANPDGAILENAGEPRLTLWQKLLSLRPLEEEHELLIPHDYDGIQELDNPIPGWFNYLFYGSIIFAIAYMLNYHVFKTGKLQYEEYKTEMADAAVARKLYLSKTANLVDETSIKISRDPAVIASGKAVFLQNCRACHGEFGQGLVGPNLTDDYWLHGGKITDVFKTVKYGVLTKGMPTWEKQLTPAQIGDVANFIESLKGSNPVGAKEAQGEKE